MTLDDIKRVLADANARARIEYGEYLQMIALLDRLQEPTDKMVTEGMVAIMNCTEPDSDEQEWAEKAYKAMIAAAEEPILKCENTLPFNDEESV